MLVASIKTLFQTKNQKKLNILAQEIPCKLKLKSRNIEILNDTKVQETRIHKNGTIVTRFYLADDKFEKLSLVQKNVLPAKNKGKSRYEGGVEFETIYTKAGKFFATLKSNCLKCDFISFVRDTSTGKIKATKSIGDFNRATDKIGLN